ncbi:MAG TPA: hypothetical protein VD815_06395, partial [Candidatus Saccharimonadales bacterium]|nr:hypothetical protein [Candidatus Saccharimonadales bacterium]
TAANETIDTTAANETIDTTAANETIDKTAANETIVPSQRQTQQQDNSTEGNVTLPPQPNSPNQSSPTSFLDPIINPFRELFGIR